MRFADGVPDPVARTRPQAIAQERLEHRCTVVNADAGTADVRDATIIAL